jgi:hypothetical protein
MHLVMYNGITNGYRNVVLTLDSQDDLVQRAICVVSGLHLSRKRPDLVGLGQQSRVLNPSTWATIRHLLIGETVADSIDYDLVSGVK